MIGFFILLLGFIACLIINCKQAIRIGEINSFYHEDKRKYAIDNYKPVWFKEIKNNKYIYIETKTNKEVYKKKDELGFEKWFYIKTDTPLNYTFDFRIENSLLNNSIIAKQNRKKWCIAEYFWDDSIVRLQNNKQLFNTYLDDYRDRADPFIISEWNKYVDNWNRTNPTRLSKNKLLILNYEGGFQYITAASNITALYKKYFYDNNPIHQKVYLKNMRPYQLNLIYQKDKSDFTPIKKKQYLIRFGYTNVFNYKTQHCISDKQNNLLWTKWYAITDKEYLELTTTSDGMGNVALTEKPLTTPISINNILKPIKETDIAFEGNNKVDWSNHINNCGIKKAFDNYGNFVEDVN